MAESMPASAAPARGTAVLIGALGVVFGDIGTSPLYTIKVSLLTMPSAGKTEILGLLSLLFWLLMLVVSVKYVILVLNADNNGEGGTLALMQLALSRRFGRYRRALMLLGLAGASLFYGDSMITPAISVLSAVEGIGVVSGRLDQAIIPVAVCVLALLFLAQSRGTGTMGRLFGPVMILWFLTIGALGAWRIAQEPMILRAVDPVWALKFLAHAPWETFVLLGALVLALTGAEALYADMGHFGRRAIRLSWFGVVLPALVLAYFGQGALLLADPSSARNPFFLMAPPWALVPLVGLATLATIIASQSVISGAFSITRQAVQLGFWPRTVIRHTSARQEGQIYLPKVNLLLFVAVLLLVLAFRSSDSLAHAYGFAVTGTMLMTSILALHVIPARSARGRRWLGILLLGFFLILDMLLFSSNALKIAEGGWLPLGVAVLCLTLMWTWKQGRDRLHEVLLDGQPPLKDFIDNLEQDPPVRVEGTAVFMSMIVGTIPPALLHNLKHNKVIHRQLVFLTVESAGVPYVPFDQRYSLRRLSRHAWEVVATWGFKQEPNVPQLLQQIAQEQSELELDPMRTSYFLSRQTLVETRRLPRLQHWRRGLFAMMARNASGSTAYFKIPPNRVVEMGMQHEL